jgi:hypothetical protein
VGLTAAIQRPDSPVPPEVPGGDAAGDKPEVILCMAAKGQSEHHLSQDASIADPF